MSYLPERNIISNRFAQLLEEVQQTKLLLDEIITNPENKKLCNICFNKLKNILEEKQTELARDNIKTNIDHIKY